MLEIWVAVYSLPTYLQCLHKIMAQGPYEDELVKVNGEWKIRHRSVKNDYLVSDPAKTG
jgi:hypothetical protein